MIIVDNAFGEELHTALSYVTKEHMNEVRLDDEATLWGAYIPDELQKLMQLVMEEATGRKLDHILSFIRYNFPEDTQEFRMHSDGLILGQQPEVAGVYYITEGTSGTGMYSHEEYGESGPGIFNEDDGKWKMVDFCEAVADRLLIYPAQNYHQRTPFKVEEERFIVVGFYKYAENVDG